MRAFRQHHSFLDGTIDIYQADSKDLLDLLVEEGLEVDEVISDPPYGIAYQGAHRPIANDEKPPLWCIPPMAHMLKPNKAMYICTREDVSEHWKQEMRLAGLNLKTSVQWDKMQWTMGDSASDLRRQTEMILIAHTGRALLVPWKDERFTGDPEKLVKRDTNIWTWPVPRDKKSQRHPTPKPPEIMERAMMNHSRPGDLILDPFMGGGPVAVAAIRQGRRYIGIELDAEYYGYAVENIAHQLGIPVPEHTTMEF